MYKILLCLRYLRTRYIALASIISVMLGVATMIVVNSVMAGFSEQMRARIHGLLADVVVETHSMSGVDDPERQMARIRQIAGKYIEAMTPTVEVYGMISFRYAGQWITRPITLIGIDPEGKSKVGPLVDYLERYNDVIENEVVVQKAVRNKDETPDWELASNAVEYRERVKRLQRRQFNELESDEHPKWLDQIEGRNAPENDGDAKKDGNAKIDFSDIKPGPSSPAGTNVDEAQPKFDSGEPGEPKSGEPNVPSKDDPFTNDPFGVANRKPYENPFPEQQQDADQTAPLKARLYVGHGLISYLFDDRKTGETKTAKMVVPGDDVIVNTISSGRMPEPRRFEATVVDVFKSGMSEYDSNLVFCNIEALQEFRGMIHPETKKGAITSIQIKLKDFDDSKEVVKLLKSAFPPGVFSIRTWEQKQGPLLAAVEVESAILNVLLFLIIAVAGFGILAIFFMIVVEKTRDIGILKALGASSRGVMSIFLSYGLGLGVVGAGVGVALGLVFVAEINQIEEFITWLTGRKVFDEKIYYFPEIPTMVNPMMVLWVAVGAMTIAVMASILPARRAAGLHPVRALRYE